MAQIRRADLDSGGMVPQALSSPREQAANRADDLVCMVLFSVVGLSMLSTIDQR